MTDTDQGLKNGEAKFLPNVAALVKRKPWEREVSFEHSLVSKGEDLPK